MAELQEILAMGQSKISTHLSQLKQAGLVEDRRTGKNSLYRLNRDRTRADGAAAAGGRAKFPKPAQDRDALRLVLRKRQDKMRALLRRAGRQVRPPVRSGTSWKGMAEALLRLMPPLVIADLGAGEGTFSQLLAAARQESDRRRQFREDGRVRRASWRASTASESRIPPRRSGRAADRSGDGRSGLLSARPASRPASRAGVAEAWRILKPGGRIAILDLNRHHFEEAREMYADLWLGFTELEIERYLKDGGLQERGDGRRLSRAGSPLLRNDAGDWERSTRRAVPNRGEFRVRWKCRWWKSSQSESKSNVKRTVGSWLRFRTFPA